MASRCWALGRSFLGLVGFQRRCMYVELGGVGVGWWCAYDSSNPSTRSSAGWKLGGFFFEAEGELELSGLPRRLGQGTGGAGGA